MDTPMQRTRLITIVAVLLFSFSARGQNPPAPKQQQQQPPPTTRPRHVAQPPPGFKRVEIDGRMFFLEPADQRWVSDALRQAAPTTMPSTMPADVLDKLRAKRAALRQRMSTDLGIKPADVDAFVEAKVLPLLQKMDELRPPIIYLVTSAQRLKDVMKSGWTDPRYYYNRAADDVSFDTTVHLTLEEGGGDDMVIPLFHDPAKPEGERGAALAREIQMTEMRILVEVSQRAQTMTMVGLIELISSKALEGITPKPDQEWFGVGAAGVLGATYAADVIGVDAQRVIGDMTRPDPRNPMRPGTLDLLRPMNVTEIRPEAITAYADAYRRRAMQVVWKLVQEAGPGAVGKVIAAIRQNPPADGPALVQQIKQATGVDLTNDLRPQ
jgi:hypothetical protein